MNGYKTVNLYLVAIILSTLGSLGFVVGFAQQLPTKKAQVATSPSATPTPTIDPMALTSEEVRDIQTILNEMNPFQQEANASYQKLISAKSSDDRYKAADQHWIAVKQLEPFQQKQIDWLTAVRKSHNCPDCMVQGGKLVPPPTPDKK